MIYILSGVTGNIASSLFTPYAVNSGAGGANFGQLGSFYAELHQNWKIIKSPFAGLLKLILLTLFLFCAGVLPWIDNFGHIFGFLSGLFLSFAIMPYVYFG